MYCQIAQSEAPNPPQSRGCRLKLSQAARGKFKKRDDASYRQKKKAKKEFEGLAAENTCLKEIIERLIANYLQVPGRSPREKETSVSHSATQDYDPSHYVPDQGHRGVDSHIDGMANDDNMNRLKRENLVNVIYPLSLLQLDGLHLNDLLDDLQSKELTVNEPVTEIPISQSIQQKTTLAEFLMKIDEDVASRVDFQDFMIRLEGEHKTIGRYKFPLALVPTVERIINVYGDISAACKINSSVTGQIYLFFCSAIKEMEDLQLEQVTEETMLKWRDAIKDALRINFKVDFAMFHLKKIARAYFGRIGSQELRGIDEKLDALYKERAEAYDGSKDCLADAEAFHGKSVGAGLFP